MAEPPSEQDWARFGLDRQASEQAKSHGGQSEFYPAASGPGDLFREEQLKKGEEAEKPWWAANFFLREPVLFGTWDGVFTSVMVNIFGVIVFLKAGWMVRSRDAELKGEAGISHAVLVLLLCLSLALCPTLSAIGICERCQIQSGGVYFLVSHIMGGQIGGAVGVLYFFGQSVGTALVAVGFGESMAHVLGSNSDWVVRLFAMGVIGCLLAINVAGVKWVIKLQLCLLALLFTAVADLVMGSFMAYDPAWGVLGLSGEAWSNNTGTNYSEGQDFFSVFGVFFSTFTGVLAGVNMSGDLRDPTRNIPLGQLAAIGTTGAVCLTFILTLGGSCTRIALQTDTLIAQRVSLTKLLFLAGLYVSSLSSILGSLYGAPRVLQSIAAENVIPFMKPLEIGRGPNKVPVWATLLMTAVSLLFVLIRDMNTLAMLATMPFLITYAFVNYSYVSLAMTYDMQEVRGVRRAVPTNAGGLPVSYGSMEGMKAAAMADAAQSEADLDHLFPERASGRLAGPPPPPPDSDTAALVPPTDDADPANPNSATLLAKDQKPSIIHQPASFYSRLCNRWVALVGAVVNMLIILLAHLGFAFANLFLLCVVYLYIGQAAPGVFPGISEFSIPYSIRVIVSKFRGGNADDEIIVAPLHPGVETFAAKLTEDNTDYATREQYHAAQKQSINPDFD